MKLPILFIAFFLTTQVFSQPVRKIKQLLKDQNFIALTSYIDKHPKSNVVFGWETLRTIVGEYQEGIVKIEENVPANDGTGGSSINNYRIYLLTDKTKIFYYNFIKTVYKYNKSADLWEENKETIDSLKDITAYFSFEDSFRQTYGDTLNYDDLFLTSIVYGSHCGITGVNPEYKEQLNSLLLDNNIDGIKQWLRSANAEKQLYALEGYRILVNQGYNPTIDEKKLIFIVEQKKGMVSTCSGCTYMGETFQNVVLQINSTPAEYLKPEKPRSSEVIFKKKSRVAKTSSSWRILFLGIAAALAIFFFIRRMKRSGPQH